jgi:ABC-2 type transport system permease protein
MSFDYRRCKSIFQKETKHILRDPFTLILAVIIPLLIVMILGNSIEFNLKEISTVVVDHDKTKESQELIRTFNSSNYFKTYFKDSPSEAFQEILKENARVVLYIPPDFDKNIASGQIAKAQILLDGANNSTVTAVNSYLYNISTMASAKITNTPIQNEFLKTRLLFNPELNSKWFAIPGLTAVIVAIVCILLTSLTICKEYELGSMELLLSTPIEPTEIIIGKVIPYAFLGWAGFCIVYFASKFVFDVPFFGNFWILLLATMIFIIDYLAIGMYISVTARQQQVAVQIALILGLLPTALLSGFVFPVEYMPKLLQYFAMIFPAKWYMTVIRAEFLKASPISDLMMPLIILSSQGIIVICATVSKFRRTLE